MDYAHLWIMSNCKFASDEVLKMWRTLTDQQRADTLEKINQVNLEGYKAKVGTDNPVILYHGTPASIGDEG